MTANGLAHDYTHIALACQGGGSLGAYHVGALEAMQEAGYKPDAVAGISIGAFTAAIVAGNEPKQRVEKLKAFWDLISWPDLPALGDASGFFKKWHNMVSSSIGFMFGQPAFFTPRIPGPSMQPTGTPAGTSYYDTDWLLRTLPQLVDFKRINQDPSTRLILGATRVRDGSPKWFDNRRQPIGPEHVMASGAMPPGFPGIRIDGELYWDGGCYSNTPLDGLYEALRDAGDTLCVVMDLFAPSGREPQDIAEVSLAMKEIQFSNRCAHNIERVAERNNHAHWFRHLLAQDKGILEKHPRRHEIMKYMKAGRFDFMHIVYKKPGWEVSTCDCEFSRSSIQDRMRQGYNDMRQALEERETMAQRRKEYDTVPDGSVIDTFARGALAKTSFGPPPVVAPAKVAQFPASAVAADKPRGLKHRGNSLKPFVVNQ